MAGGGIRYAISIDTYKASVAEEATKSGASILNDVWGLKADPALAGTAFEADVPVILMHTAATPITLPSKSS